MSSGAGDPADHVARSSQPNPSADFLVDARHNLVLVAEVFGPQSARYERLVNHYRLTADELGCRADLEHVLASLAPPSQTNL